MSGQEGTQLCSFDRLCALLSIHNLVFQGSVWSGISVQPTLSLNVACRFCDVPVWSYGRVSLVFILWRTFGAAWQESDIGQGQGNGLQAGI